MFLSLFGSFPCSYERLPTDDYQWVDQTAGADPEVVQRALQKEK